MTKESSSYENLVGEKVDTTPVTLEDLVDGELVSVTTQDWKDHWKGMPEYVSEDQRYTTVRVQFRNKEDFQEFQRLIGQNLTEKTQGIWFPALEKEENFLMRWIEDDES